ncbi:MAG: molybdopterin-dependent oxidoreductase [Planctomycetota bacterium]|nr:molybdopterin-dependent oxidoreductase [Planctomycetota bacterium]
MNNKSFLEEHARLTRRYFMGLVTAGGLLSGAETLAVTQENNKKVKPEKAGARPEPYFTPSMNFRDVSRGKPLPHSLPDEKKREVGLTRDTWRLEVLADPDHPAKIGNPLTRATNNALDFAGLLKLGEKQTIRFAKVMTCLNLGCPLGMGLWEGVALRDVVWLAQPEDKLRRVFYHGYHNNDPKQVFRSSLPVGRVLEDPPGLPPVILCYKLNGEWLDSERGGPVRMVVPEDYGFKSVKWLSHLFLTNLATSNDTYADQGNDVDSPMKTFAATLSIPRTIKAGEAIAVTGYAQVGISGLSKVQVSLEPSTGAKTVNNIWKDAELLSAPARWTGLMGETILPGTHGFDATGKPQSWPMRLTNAHWATVLPGVPAGEYTFRCRTIDAQGIAQPLPRPFRNSGHAKIETVTFSVQ